MLTLQELKIYLVEWLKILDPGGVNLWVDLVLVLIAVPAFRGAKLGWITARSNRKERGGVPSAKRNSDSEYTYQIVRINTPRHHRTKQTRLMMTSGNSSVPAAPTNPAGLLEWPNLKSVAPNSRGSRWESHDPPKELQRLPEDEETPHELASILKWSLRRPEPFQSGPTNGEGTAPVPEPASAPTELAGKNDSSSSVLCDDASHAETKVEGGGLSRDDSRGRSRSSRRSTSVERRRSRLRQIKSPGALLASAVDLFNTMTGRPEEMEGVEPEKPTAVKTVECTSCFDDIATKDATSLSCSHSYCQTCFKTMITTAMQVEANYPPKCCLTEIPLPTIILALDSKQREEYKEKAKEYSIPAGSRWYCPSTKCSKWIPPSKLQRLRATNQCCPHCHTKMCSVCRGLAHDENQDCPQDFGLEATLDIADSEGWQRCYRCRAMVELSTGCHHITCKCGAQFCYVCGLRWKTCSCTATDEQGRQNQLRQQRAARDAAIQVEAEEVARAIAEVEEYERQQEATRLAEEARRAEERRKEEEELAELERLRQEEEQRREKMEEELEQQRIAVMKLSVEERVVFLRERLEKIAHYQQSALTSRHETEEFSLLRQLDESTFTQRQSAERMTARISSNIEKRMKALKEKHRAESEALGNKEREECNVFINVQVYLTGNLAQEEQERRATEEFRKHFRREIEIAQKHRMKEVQEHRQKIEKRHRAETQALEEHTHLEREVVERTNEYKLSEATVEHHQNLRKLGVTVFSDRQWFSVVTERRMRMLELHITQMLHDVEADQETTGLTENMALRVIPLPALEPEVPWQAGEGKEVLQQSNLQLLKDARPSSAPALAVSTTMSGPQPTRLSEVLAAKPGVTSLLSDQNLRPRPLSKVISASPSIYRNPIAQPNEQAWETSSIRELDAESACSSSLGMSTRRHSPNESISSNPNPWEEEMQMRESPQMEGKASGVARSNAVRKSAVFPSVTLPTPTSPEQDPAPTPALKHKLRTTMRGSLPAVQNGEEVLSTTPQNSPPRLGDGLGPALALSTSIERPQSMLSVTSASASVSATSGSTSTSAGAGAGTGWEKKSKWPSFGRKKGREKMSEEELRERLRGTIGDAF